MAKDAKGMRRRDPGLRALSRNLSGLTAPLLQGRSRAEASLLQDWDRIAGTEIAAVCRVGRLSFPKRTERRNARLTLQCDPGAALDLQHATPQLIERVNGYFGFALVAEIALQQRPKQADPRRPEKRGVPAPDRAALAEAERRTAEIEDAELRGAMTRLAAAVAAQRRGTKE